MTHKTLFLLKPITNSDAYIESRLHGWPYGINQGFVIRAKNEKKARKIAAKNSGSEGIDTWLNIKGSTCIALIPSGKSGLILADFSEN